MAKKRPKFDIAQKSLFDTLDFSEKEKKEIKITEYQLQHIHISHESHIEDSKKNIKHGGLKDNSLGRIRRGMFITNNGLEINDDVMSSYNQIRKYLIAIGKPINILTGPNIDEINGLGDGMLRPICLRIEKCLSEDSKSLISMIHTKKPLEKQLSTNVDRCQYNVNIVNNIVEQ